MALILLLVNSVWFVADVLYFSIDDLPKGKYNYSLASPDYSKELKIYTINNSLGKAVRIEMTKGNKAKNVFWQTDIDTVDLAWANNEEIVVNGMKINVSNGGYYDCRRGTSILLEGSIEPGVEK